jgi:hypothetical protein
MHLPYHEEKIDCGRVVISVRNATGELKDIQTLEWRQPSCPSSPVVLGNLSRFGGLVGRIARSDWESVGGTQALPGAGPRSLTRNSGSAFLVPRYSSTYYLGGWFLCGFTLVCFERNDGTCE